MTAFRGPRNLPGTDSSCLPGILRIRTALSNRGIVRVCLLSGRKDTANFDRRFKLEQHGLFEKDLFGFEAQSAHFRFEQLHVLASIFQQLVDDLVDINLFGCIHLNGKKL